MNAETKYKYWIGINRFFNSTFAAWFFPSIVLVGLGIWIKECQFSADKKDLSNQIINEINIRINFANEKHNNCKYAIEKKWENDSETQKQYEIIFNNLLTPFPVYDNIDSINYSPKFRNESLPNLLFRLKSLNKKYTKNYDKYFSVLNKIKDYYKTHEIVDSESFYYLTILIKDSLNTIEIK